MPNTTTTNKSISRWHGWYSPMAVARGCPVFTYVDKYQNEIKVTGVTPGRDGLGYPNGDKQYVGELTGLKSTKSTYLPHRDFYRYWW